jgi:hypothetical protein
MNTTEQIKELRTSELIKVLAHNNYRLTAVDTGEDSMARFILGVKLDEPIDAWYIAQILAPFTNTLVPQFAYDNTVLAFLNAPILNQKDFESILASY